MRDVDSPIPTHNTIEAHLRPRSNRNWRFVIQNPKHLHVCMNQGCCVKAVNGFLALCAATLRLHCCLTIRNSSALQKHLHFVPFSCLVVSYFYHVSHVVPGALCFLLSATSGMRSCLSLSLPSEFPKTRS